MDIPVLRWHPTINETNIAEEVLECFKHSPWQICVPFKDNLYWSVALSYLMLHTKDWKTEMISRVSKMVESKIVDGERIASRVNRYNPFLNRHSCYFDKDFVTFVGYFKTKIHRFVTDASNDMYFSSFEKIKRKGRLVTVTNFSSLLQASAYVLECEISLIIPESSEGDSCLTKINFPLDAVDTARKDRIVLYGEKKSKSRVPNLHFCLPLSTADKLQKNAFCNVLRSAGIKNQKEMDVIYSLPESRINLFSTLLKSGYTRMTRLLLRCPLNVAFKLHQACFGIDPTKPDNEQRNAFFYALCTSEVDLLFLLHAFYINTALWNSNSTREPDGKVKERLEKLTAVLAGTQEDYKTSKQKTCQGMVSVEELIAFHAFQVAVCGKIISLRPDENDDRLREAKRRKEVVGAILEAYVNHFNVRRNEEADTLALYDDYMKFPNYIHVLDFQTFLFFFDNIFALKDRLKLEGKYKDIETPMARFIFWKWSCLKNQFLLSSAEARQLEDMPTTMVFLERVSFKTSIDSFRKILSETEITNDNTVDELSYEEIHTLESEPIIKDEFVLRRFKHYIDMAINVDLNNNSTLEIGVLAIERCVQVIGETLSFEKSENPTVLKSLMVSCVQEVTKLDLRKIRHILSHSHFLSIACRLEIEKDKQFFQGIQEEIKSLDQLFGHIYELQSLRIRKYSHEKGIEMINEWKSSLENWKPKTEIQAAEEEDRSFSETFLHMPVEDFYTFSNQYSESVDCDITRLKRCNKLLEDLRKWYDVLASKVEETGEELTKKLRNSIDIYKRHLCVHLSWIEKKCQILKPSSESYEEDVKIEQRFKSLQVLLDFLVTESRCDEQQQAELLEQLNSSINSLHAEKFKELLEQFKTHVSCAVNKFRMQGWSTSASPPIIDCGKQIHKLMQVLKGFCFVSRQRKDDILNSVPQDYIDHHRIKEELINSLQANKILSEKVVEEKVKKLVLKSKQKKKVMEMYEKRDHEGLKSACIDYYEILKTSLDEDQIAKKNYETICGRFKLSKEHEEELGKIVMGRDPGVRDKTVEFFYKRVEMLKRLLVDRYPDIQRLWKEAISKNTKKYAHDKLVCYFLQDPLLQAAVEQLLFDCMIVLKERDTRLEQVWVKANLLFNGISLRNVFAHGHPLFECVGSILDPSDLPNEMIAKVLQLVLDIEAIGAMHRLVQDRPSMGFEEFVSEVLADAHDKHRDLWRKVRACPNWEGYARLLPEARVRSETVSSIGESDHEEL